MLRQPQVNKLLLLAITNKFIIRTSMLMVRNKYGVELKILELKMS